jgi:hypothetical protein
MAKQACQQARRYHGPTTHAAAMRAHTLGGEDPNGGLFLHSSSGQAGGSPSQVEAATVKTLSASPPLTANWVDKMYHQLAEIHTIATTQLTECAR